MNLSSEGRSEPERITAVRATANLLSILQLRPSVGRDFNEAEDRAGAPHVLLISDKLWRGRFGASAAVVGSQVTLDGVPFEVIGVMPPQMQWGDGAEVLIPLGELRGDPAFLRRGNRAGFFAVGRLADKVSPAQAKAEFDTISRTLENQHAENIGRRVDIRSLLDSTVGEYRSSVYVLVAAVGCVLLIACANVAGLLLSRASARQREFGIRAALGATSSRITIQLIIESFLIAGIGAFIGLILTFWGLSWISAFGPADQPRLQSIKISMPVLLFALTVTAFTALLSGTWPGWRMGRSANPLGVLREGGYSTSDGADRQRLRATLVVTQLAFALLLLISAGLVGKSLWRLQSTPLGFKSDGLLLMSIALPPGKYSADDAKARFYDDLLRRVRELPGVSGVAVGRNIPFDHMNWDSTFHITGAPAEVPGKEPRTEVSVVSPDYFSTMGIQLLNGRSFSSEDAARPDWSVIIDESFASRFFQGQNPIGKHIDNHLRVQPRLPPLTIVGVVTRTVNNDPGGPAEAAHLPQMYVSTNQYPQEFGMLIVRSVSGNPMGLGQAVKRQLLLVDPDQPPYDTTTMAKAVGESLASRRFTVTLLGLFSAIALGLATVGVFAIMALRVTQQTRQIGIRLALGATRGDIFRLVLRSGIKLTAVGIALGLCASAAATKLLSSLLFGVSIADPVTYLAVVGLLTSVSLLAVCIPALRAIRVNPIVALRTE